MSDSVRPDGISAYPAGMTMPPPDAIAVIFLSGRNDADDVGYGAAARVMEAPHWYRVIVASVGRAYQWARPVD